MRFELHQAAADGDDIALAKLNELLGRVEDDVHELVFDDPTAIEQSRWFQHLFPHLKTLVYKLIAAPLWQGPQRATQVHIRAPADARPARDAAMTPLAILVENDASDGALVTASMLAFADEATLRVWSAGERANPPGWTYVFCGGETSRKIREHGAKDGAAGPRAIVMLDSDEELPPHLRAHGAPGKKAPDEALARGLGLHVHVLPLREAENYLPDAFWDAWLDESRDRTSYRPVIAALCRLTPDQRDHLDMEGDKRIQASTTFGPLFDGSDPANPQPAADDIKQLAGNRKNLKQGSKDPKTQVRPYRIRLLPDHVHRGTVTASDLDQRDRAGALRALVQTISREL